ncbi:hypothetical protein ACJX0J_015671, partial [Zea mays]
PAVRTAAAEYGIVLFKGFRFENIIVSTKFTKQKKGSDQSMLIQLLLFLFYSTFWYGHSEGLPNVSHAFAAVPIFILYCEWYSCLPGNAYLATQPQSKTKVQLQQIKYISHQRCQI